MPSHLLTINIKLREDILKDDIIIFSLSDSDFKYFCFLREIHVKYFSFYFTNIQKHFLWSDLSSFVLFLLSASLPLLPKENVKVPFCNSIHSNNNIDICSFFTFFPPASSRCCLKANKSFGIHRMRIELSCIACAVEQIMQASTSTMKWMLWWWFNSIDWSPGANNPYNFPLTGLFGRTARGRTNYRGFIVYSNSGLPWT